MPVTPVRMSAHARFEMSRRSIRPGEVVRTIRHAGQVLPEIKGRQIYQSLIGPARRMLLRVVVKELAVGISCSNRIQDQQSRQVLENAVKVIYDKETDALNHSSSGQSRRKRRAAT